VGVSDRARVRGLTVVAVAGTVFVVAAVVSMLMRGRPLDLYYELFIFHNAPGAIILLWLSWLVLRRYPRHGAGIVLLVVALASGLHVGVAVLLDARLETFGMDLATLDPDVQLIPAEMPLSAALLHMLLATVWVPASVPVFTLLVLLFPDGRLPGPRWRWAALSALAGMAVIVIGFAIVTWPTVGEAEPSLGGEPIDAVLIIPGGLAIVVAAAASVVALVRRWRRATGAERTPFRAVAIAVLVLVIVATAAYPWPNVWAPAVLIAFSWVLVTYALAVGRYRLHDVEPILGRAAVGAILVLVVAAVYVAIVVVIGSLVGQGIDSPVLSLAAVAVVALLVEPARRRARRLVDRVVYRQRATHAEVLSELARSASSEVPDRVIEEVASLLLTSTGASRAEVWLDVIPVPQRAAAAGISTQREPITRADVTHQDERLGEIRLYASARPTWYPEPTPSSAMWLM
jgi:two-component system, NarL family, sensor kinase